MQTTTYTGLISSHMAGEEEALFLSDHIEPLAEELSWCHQKRITVRYWITNVKCTKDEAVTETLNRMEGVGNVEYGANYSELTGYLWTDEWIKVGGHDLIKELSSHKGKWVILEIDAE